MEHIIAYNPYKNGNKGSVSSQPLSVYDKTIAYPWMADLVAAIRGGNDELKKQLPFRCAHYYQFRDNRRSQKNAVPESFLFQTTIDVDDKEYVDKAIEKARELNCSDTIWKGALLHLEYSARKKLHIDIRMPIGMTIEETQRAYCEALGVPYDESCITPERMLFITDKASEIYRSPHWYEVLPQEELEKRRQAYLDRGLTIDGKIVNSLQFTVNSADAVNSPHQVNSNHKVQISKFKVIVIIKFKVQISKFKVKTMFKTIDFRALTAIVLFLLALLFSLPNLVIAMLLMLLISALLELIRMLGLWQPARTSQPSTSSAMLQA